MKLLIALPFVLLFSTALLADNPVIQNLYSADPAPMVYGDKVYLYTSHDDDVTENNFFTMRDWLCYSSSDMVNWTDHGIVASLKMFNWINVNNGGWAPQCIERDGKFYLYVPIQGKGIGVLVADSPTGPFKDPINKALVFKSWDDIDPTAFVDSDGQAYLYWGNPGLWYVKLNENMTSYSGNIETIQFTDQSFGKRSGAADAKRPCTYEEGPWFYKRNNLYYMIFAGGPLPEHIGYSTSSGPTGPWTYKGIIMTSQQGFAFTNHAGVCDFKDNSYIFYHNQKLSNSGYKRSVCVEQFTYGNDGSIPSITATQNGPNQIGSLNPYDTIQAETICWGQGVETEVCSDGGMNVGNIENGDYIKVKGVDFGAGADSFEAKVASNTSGGKIELRLGSATGTLVGTCGVEGTGGWQNWTTKTCDVYGATGKHDLYLKFTGGSGSLFNFDWWRFKEPYVGVEKSVKSGALKGNEIKVYADKKSVTLKSGSFASNNNMKVELYDFSGKMVCTLFQGKTKQHDLSFNLPAIRSGTYLVKILAGSEAFTKTINIQ